MIKYVSKTGSNSNSGESLSQAYLTVGYAVSQLSSGGVIYVYPGRYIEMVQPASNTKLIAISEHGEVEIAGDGNRAAIEIWGKHHVTVDGFIITNNGATIGGWSVPSGISIADAGNVRGVNNHSHDITIQNCTFRDILRKNDAVGNGAQALSVRSFSDTRLGH